MAVKAYFQCEYCKEYKPKGKRLKKYCSRKCRDAAYYERKTADAKSDKGS